MTAAYLVRDRDVKLRVYPSLAPVLIMPIMMMLPVSNREGAGLDLGFGLAFAGAFVSKRKIWNSEDQEWQGTALFLSS